jgi:murein DD-endopeptidase MepM/ murein hydrolase activator NlpD
MRNSLAFVLGVLVSLSVSAGRRPVDDGGLLARVRTLENASTPALRRPTQLLERIERLEAEFRQADIADLRSTPQGSPVVGGVVTSGVSAARFHPILHRWKPHTGVDIAVNAGAPIHATADGIVSSVFDNASYGLGVDLNHGRGTLTRYGHMLRVLVKPGQKVRRGDEIGLVGRSGRATGPHVHYEVFLRWHRVDAGVFLPDSMPVAVQPGLAGDY